MGLFCIGKASQVVVPAPPSPVRAPPVAPVADADGQSLLAPAPGGLEARGSTEMPSSGGAQECQAIAPSAAAAPAPTDARSSAVEEGSAPPLPATTSKAPGGLAPLAPLRPPVGMRGPGPLPARGPLPALNVLPPVRAPLQDVSSLASNHQPPIATAAAAAPPHAAKAAAANGLQSGAPPTRGSRALLATTAGVALPSVPSSNDGGAQPSGHAAPPLTACAALPATTATTAPAVRAHPDMGLPAAPPFPPASAHPNLPLPPPAAMPLAPPLAPLAPPSAPPRAPPPAAALPPAAVPQPSAAPSEAAAATPVTATRSKGVRRLRWASEEPEIYLYTPTQERPVDDYRANLTALQQIRMAAERSLGSTRMSFLELVSEVQSHGSKGRALARSRPSPARTPRPPGRVVARSGAVCSLFHVVRSLSCGAQLDASEGGEGLSCLVPRRPELLEREQTWGQRLGLR